MSGRVRLNNINNFNMKACKSMYKYNKVTQQKKFHLLTLVLHQKLLIKQAAKIVGINYSTAKTIMFFNRNLNKSYQFSFQNNTYNSNNDQPKQHASYREITSFSHGNSNFEEHCSRVTIINSIGSEKALRHSQIHKKKLSGNFTKRQREQQDELSDEYLEQQKLMESRRLERPRTRSQSNGCSLALSNKSQGHQKRDFQSSAAAQNQVA